MEWVGVFVMMVLWVLNGEFWVCDEICEWVFEVMKVLDYWFNIFVCSLVKVCSFFLGFFYNNLNFGYVSELLIGMMNCC